MSNKEWYAAEVFVSAGAREAIEYGLMEAGAAGTETKDSEAGEIITGYFERKFDEIWLRRQLIQALATYQWDEDAVTQFRSYTVSDRDWLAEWKKNWQPISVGRFIVTPSWLASASGAAAGASDSHDRLPAGANTDPITIVIDPGMAFGTGTHETTRLCLQAIEKYFHGSSFLDVGTGTGILAIAAAKAFPDAQVTACDTDAEAVEIAKDNARLNDVGARIDFRVGSVDDRTGSADFVCANLTAPVIVELLPSLIGATCGRLVLSGILVEQTELVRSQLTQAGVTTMEVTQDGEWVSIVV